MQANELSFLHACFSVSGVAQAVIENARFRASSTRRIVSLAEGVFVMSNPSTSTPFNLPGPIRQSLGDVVIGWARVDALMAEFLSFLLHAERGAMYVLNQDVAGGTQMKWIRSLIGERFTNENTLAGLKVLLFRIDGARAERNAYVHGLWRPGPEEGTALVQTIKLDRVEAIRDELVTAANLNELFSDIESVGDELQDILTKLNAFD